MEFSLSVSSETDMPHMREYAQEPPLMFSAAPPLLWAVHSPIISSMPPFTTVYAVADHAAVLPRICCRPR